jgi:two-component system nitrate/nitrite sensor histidine kinase NarX
MSTPTEGPRRRLDGGLRRLKVAGVGLPILFFIAIEAVRLSFTSGGIGLHSFLLLFIVVAVIAFSFVMFHFIERAQAQMRESERQAAILAERERIARELHDSLAQVLGATHLRLRALAAGDDVGDAPSLAPALDELADICEEGYRDARGAILDLRESSRADRGLLEGLRAYLDKYSRQCGIATSLETTMDDELALPPRSEIQIIRVIQEALTNVRKHSGAASAAVRVTQTNATVRFVVEDNGHGFDSAEAPPDRDGFGLHSMRERMELIGGTLLTDSAAGRGTRVVAEVPATTRASSDRVELDASLS